jgi:hypothetical protein
VREVWEAFEEVPMLLEEGFARLKLQAVENLA